MKTLSEHLLNARNFDSQKVSVMYKKKDQWIKLNWQQYFQTIENCALGLLEFGFKRKDKVAIFSNTRFEWSIIDHAVIGLGGIIVPLYQTMTTEDVEFIINNSQAKYIFIENDSLLRLFNQIKGRCPSIEKVLIIENEKQEWTKLLQAGEVRKSRTSEEFAKHCRENEPADTITIIYTSGTTGTPKGVVLSHEQALSECIEAFEYVGATDADVSLSFLPYAHILGRIEHWAHICIGYKLAFAESIEKIKLNLQDINPTFLISVPRIFEKVYAGVLSQINNNLAVRNIFNWAINIGKNVSAHKLEHKPLSIKLFAEYKLAQKLVLHKVTDIFGGKLRFAVSGGAPLSKEIADFFHSCGVLILEGYGLTETTAAITVNTPFDYQFGDVGKPIGDVQIKIAEDGEILIKSKKVMKEYYNNPEATRSTLTDGWLYTGDIGEISSSGRLKITDRKKDLIKTSGGKYIAPQKIENLLKAHPMISHALIHGDQKKFVVALLTLNKTDIINYAKEKNINYQDFAQLTQTPQISEVIRKCIAETNKSLASFETIKRFTILPSDFSVEAGELTPSLKIKRKFLDQKYKKEIEALYT